MAGRPQRPDKGAIKQALLAGLAEGVPLAVVARRHGVARETLYAWKAEEPAFAEAVAEARDAGFDSLAAECLSIADNSRNDYVEQFNDAGESQGWRFNSENVLRSRLRVETRLKLLRVWDPKRYAETAAVKVDAQVTEMVKHTIDPRQLDPAGRDALRTLLEQAAVQELIGAEPDDEGSHVIEGEARLVDDADQRSDGGPAGQAIPRTRR